MNDEDDIPPFFLRIAKNILSFPLAFIINHNFSLGIFPKTLQNFAVFNEDDARNISNYRPISLLPFISKIYERTIYNRTVCFLIAITSLLPINSILGKVSFSTNRAIPNLITKCYDHI